jgi:hypothetical protein
MMPKAIASVAEVASSPAFLRFYQKRATSKNAAIPRATVPLLRRILCAQMGEYDQCREKFSDCWGLKSLNAKE